MSSHSLYDPAAQTGIVWRVWDPVEGMFCASGRSLYAKNGRSVWMSRGAASVALGQMPAEVRARAVVCAYNLVPVQPALVQGATVVADGEPVVTLRWPGGPRYLDQGDVLEVVVDMEVGEA